MNYELYYEGQSYDLPKKTPKVMRLLEAAYAAQGRGIDKEVSTQYAFVCACLTKPVTDKLCEYKSMDDLECSVLTILTQSIRDAYLKPVLDHEKELEAAQMERPAFAAIKSIGESAKSIQILSDQS